MTVTTIPIDCLAVAWRILSSPTAVYSATAFEIVAMAACTVRESTGEMPDLPVIGEPPQPSASLAAAVARLLRAEAGMAAADASDADLTDTDNEFHAAWAALQTVFEKEFPDGR